MKLDARTFKKSVLNICKAIPSQTNLNIHLIVRSKSYNMIIFISTSIEKTADYYADKPIYCAFAVVGILKKPEPLSFKISPQIIDEFLNSHICNRNETISIEKKWPGLELRLPGQSEPLFLPNAQCPVDDDVLEFLKKKRCEKIQVENFSYYFKETKHALGKPQSRIIRKDAFLLKIDTEDHIMVASENRYCLSARGNIGEVKYTYYLHKPEMERAAAILGDDVTIRITQNYEYLQMTAGNILVSIPMLRCFPLYTPMSDKLKSFHRKPLLSFTALREELLQCLKSVKVPGNRDIVFSLKKNTLELRAFNKVTGTDIVVSPRIEDCLQDTDTPLRIHGKYLYDALRSINSINVCIEFMPPYYVRVTDYHINSRRLPHSLSSTEFFWPYIKDTETPTLPEPDNGNS